MMHTNNGQQYWLQEVPMEAKSIDIFEVTPNILDYVASPNMRHQVKLPDGTWQIHSDSLTITEEQAAEVVEGEVCEISKKNGIDAIMYNDYEGVEDYFFTAVSSFHSLLRSLGLQDKRIIVLKKM